MKTFGIYFAQINQTRYVVRAEDREGAIAKAAREWKQDNGPFLISVEEYDAEPK